MSDPTLLLLDDPVSWPVLGLAIAAWWSIINRIDYTNRRVDGLYAAMGKTPPQPRRLRWNREPDPVPPMDSTHGLFKRYGPR